VERIGGIRIEGTSVLANIDALSFPNGIDGSFSLDNNHPFLTSVHILCNGNITGDLTILHERLTSISFRGLTRILSSKATTQSYGLRLTALSPSTVNTVVSFPDLIYVRQLYVDVSTYACGYHTSTSKLIDSYGNGS
jgi:hypothetical protein